MSVKKVIIEFTKGETRQVYCRDCGRVQNMKVEKSTTGKILVFLTFDKKMTQQNKKRIKEEKMNTIVDRFKKNRKERKEQNGKENRKQNQNNTRNKNPQMQTNGG